MAFLIPATEAGERRVPDYLYSTFDLAIDHEQSDTDAYSETLDAKHLRALPGKRLTRFEFRAVDEVLSEQWECTAGSSVKLMSVLYYRGCVVRLHDVQIKDGDQVKFGKADANAYVPVLIKQEIGMYARKLCTEVAPDFFGRSLLTSADDTTSSSPGATNA